MTVSVYVASRFPDQADAKRLRDALAEHGIGCTSRWLEEEPSLDATLTDERRRYIAAMDVFDVRRAQALVLWNPTEKHKVGTGGCHTEVGMALAWGLPVFVVGYDSNDPLLVGYDSNDPLPEIRSNVFMFLPQVRCFTWPNHVPGLAAAIREACPDFGPTWDSPSDQAAKGVTLERKEKAVLDRQVSCDHKVQFIEPDRGRICVSCLALVGGVAP